MWNQHDAQPAIMEVLLRVGRIGDQRRVLSYQVNGIARALHVGDNTVDSQRATERIRATQIRKSENIIVPLGHVTLHNDVVDKPLLARNSTRCGCSRICNRAHGIPAFESPDGRRPKFDGIAGVLKL